MLTARRLQRTIAREAEVRGVGFILGSDVSLRFRPAAADTGIVFVRTDLPGRPSVRRAQIDNVIPRRQRRTTIQQGEAVRRDGRARRWPRLAGGGIADRQLSRIEIDAPEDPRAATARAWRSSRPSLAAGTVELDRDQPGALVIEPRTVTVHREGRAVVSARPVPDDGGIPRALTYHLDYGSDSPIGVQDLSRGPSP